MKVDTMKVDTMKVDPVNDIGSRRFHRWSAVLALIVICYVTVLNLGMDWSLGWNLTIACGGLGLIGALVGVAVSIVYPPQFDEVQGMMRPYTLFVSLELCFFVLGFGVTQIIHTPTAVKVLLAVIWLGINFRLLHIASLESDGESPLIGMSGGLLGFLCYAVFLVLCHSFLPRAGTASEMSRLLISGLLVPPVAAKLGFVIAASFGTTPPSILTWARAGTAYLVVLPSIMAVALALF